MALPHRCPSWRSPPSARPRADVVLRYPPHALLVVGGVPGAGKTTLLQRLFRGGGHAVVLDSEQVKAAVERRLRTRRGYRVLRPFVHAAHWLRIGRALRGDRPVVVHDTATRTQSRRALAAWARCHGREPHLLLLDVDPTSAVAGQRARGRRIRPSSMQRHVRRFEALRSRVAVHDGVDGFASVITLSRGDARRLRAVRFVAVAGGGRV